MADFPSSVYSPRTKENKAGIAYDADKTTIGYSEDITKLDDEVVAIETFLSPKLLTLRPEINTAEIAKRTVPAQVQRGVFFGYTLPVYNSDYQELFVRERVPYRWDGTSDIRVKIRIALAGAEDVGDKFQFRFAWEHEPCSVELPDTSNDVDVETIILVDRNAIYDEYCVTFVIDHDIDGVGNEVKAGELMAGRLRRIAASSLEATGDIILLDFAFEYQIDKFGGPF